MNGQTKQRQLFQKSRPSLAPTRNMPPATRTLRQPGASERTGLLASSQSSLLHGTCGLYTMLWM